MDGVTRFLRRIATFADENIIKHPLTSMIWFVLSKSPYFNENYNWDMYSVQTLLPLKLLAGPTRAMALIAPILFLLPKFPKHTPMHIALITHLQCVSAIMLFTSMQVICNKNQGYCYEGFIMEENPNVIFKLLVTVLQFTAFFHLAFDLWFFNGIRSVLLPSIIAAVQLNRHDSIPLIIVTNVLCAAAAILSQNLAVLAIALDIMLIQSYNFYLSYEVMKYVEYMSVTIIVDDYESDDEDALGNPREERPIIVSYHFMEPIDDDDDDFYEG